MDRKIIAEKDYRLAFQKMVLDLSFSFMEVNDENLNNKIEDLLKKLGEFLNSDRTYIFSIDSENQIFFDYEWVNKNLSIESIEGQVVDLNKFPSWKQKIAENKETYCIENIESMSFDENKEQNYLRSLDIQSTITVRIDSEDDYQGKRYVAIDSINSKHQWKDEDTEILKAIAKIIASGINRADSKKKIKYMHYFDPLTGLANQNSLDEKIIKGIKEVKKNHNYLSLLFIDLDNFKGINDSLGHHYGDLLLAKLMERLLKIIGNKDTLSRMGGDEFLLLLSDYDDKNYVDHILSQIISIFKKPFTLNNQIKYITASIGLSEYPKDGESPNSLIKNADIAMYHAKDLGKNQYQKMTEDLKKTTKKKISLIDDLHHALDRGELEVYYQPVVKVKNEEITTLEALIRWKHPEHGFVPPSEFIPLAEQIHLIYPIGCFVRTTVAKQLKDWNKKGFKNINIAVNFSVYELLNPKLKNNLEELINKFSLSPENIEIEITESLAMNDLDNIIIHLDEITQLGHNLTIDDYGKGYSSLRRLRDLPINKMKIDKVFIDGIGKDPEDEIIIDGLFSFARSLSLDIVAEGVETKEQVDFLKNYDQCLIQGFYYYKPMPAAKVEKILENNVKNES